MPFHSNFEATICGPFSTRWPSDLSLAFISQSHSHSRGSGKGGKGAERRNGKGKGGWEKDHGGKGNMLEKEECPKGSATRV